MLGKKCLKQRRRKNYPVDKWNMSDNLTWLKALKLYLKTQFILLRNSSKNEKACIVNCLILLLQIHTIHILRVLPWKIISTEKREKQRKREQKSHVESVHRKEPFSLSLSLSLSFSLSPFRRSMMVFSGTRATPAVAQETSRGKDIFWREGFIYVRGKEVCFLLWLRLAETIARGGK